MPIYQYENRDGEIISYILPVDQRDGVKGLKRIPSAPFISRNSPDPSTSSEGAKRFYRDAEEKGTLKSRRYSKNKVKEIWGVDKSRMACNRPQRTPDGPKKFVVKACRNGEERIVRFGDPKMTIKKEIPARRKSFMARHNCSEQKDNFSAAYWSCRAWR